MNENPRDNEMPEPNLVEGAELDSHTDGPRTGDASDEEPASCSQEGYHGAQDGGDAGVDADIPQADGTLGESDSSFGGAVDDADLPGGAVQQSQDAQPDAESYPTATEGDGSEQLGDPTTEGTRPPEYS